MTNQEAIKTAPDVVKIHHYESGRLVATEYKSSLGTALERHDTQESKSEVLYAEDGIENAAAEEKPKRR